MRATVGRYAISGTLGEGGMGVVYSTYDDRGASEFAGLLKRAETRHRQAGISFLSAEGDRILGIPHPV